MRPSGPRISRGEVGMFRHYTVLASPKERAIRSPHNLHGSPTRRLHRPRKSLFRARFLPRAVVDDREMIEHVALHADLPTLQTQVVDFQNQTGGHGYPAFALGPIEGDHDRQAE